MVVVRFFFFGMGFVVRRLWSGVFVFILSLVVGLLGLGLF